jgi:minor extracellular serine protease Vpr
MNADNTEVSGPRIALPARDMLTLPAFTGLSRTRGGVMSPGIATTGGRLPRVEKLAMKATILLFAAALSAFAQVVPGRYVLELSQDPAAVAAYQAGARVAAREAAFAARRAGVRQTQMSARAAVAAHGGRVVESMDTVLNALIVEIPDARASELMQIPGALQLHPVHRVRPFLNHALPLHKVPDAWNLLPLGQNSAGAGIKIGMIDTGIDITNAAFSDSLPAFDGFPKFTTGDKQFTNAKVIVAKNYTQLLPDGGDPDANDRDGHGTGTALAAAGGSALSPYGPVMGVATKAYLGNYKVLDANGATSDVIAKAIDDAVADGMDVLNLSLGGYVTSYADFDSREPSVAAIERATKAGVIVVVAAGNDGPDAGTVSDYANVADTIAMGAIHNDRTLGYGITADGVSVPYQAAAGNGPDPGQVISGTLLDVTTVDATGQACSHLPSVAGKVVLVQRGNCNFSVKVNNVAAAGGLAIIVYNNTSGLLRMDVGSATLPAMGIAQTDGQDLKVRVAQNPGMQVALDFTGATAFPAPANLSDFSSRGPSVGRAIKPDLLAVGEEIVTGAQYTYSDGESYSPSGFIDTAGTSFSSPLGAGAAAVLKAARPGLTVAQYRSLLINGGTPSNATVSQGGAGVMNVAAAVSGTVTAFPTALNLASGGTQQLTLTNVSGSSDTYAIQAVPAAGSPAPTVTGSVQLDPGVSQQIAVSLDGTGLAPGEYSGYLVVTGTNAQTTARIPYWFAVRGTAPAGISVLYQDFFDAVRSSSVQAVVIRVVDASGLPYTGNAQPTISSSSGTIRRFYRIGDIPGTYAVDIRTGTADMAITFTIGDISTQIVIPVL